MKPLKIVLISHSDTAEAHDIATYRLMNAMRHKGHDARMLVFYKNTNDPNVVCVSSKLARQRVIFKEHLGVFFHNGYTRSSLTKVSIGKAGLKLHNNRLVKEADVVLLGRISQGAISMRSLKHICAMDKKIIWSMHDMWCMTGICHQAIDCKNYTQECGNCQYLGLQSGPRDLSHHIWDKKHHLTTRLPIRFVAVCNWLRNKARESSLLRNKHIEVIPNIFPVEDFPAITNHPLSHPVAKYFNNVICFGAQRLDDPVKGLNYAIDALNIIVDEDPEVASHCVAIFFGHTRNDEAFQRLRFPHIIYGTISDHETLHSLYCASKIVLSTSIYETLPDTVAEGQASGAIPVVFGNGGQTDFIDHMVNGYIARFPDIRDIAKGIKWALQADIPRQYLHRSVAEKFSADVIADRYLKLIEDFNVSKS